MSGLLSKEQIKMLSHSCEKSFIAHTDYELLIDKYLDNWRDIYECQSISDPFSSLKHMRARHEVEECLEMYKAMGLTLAGAIARTMAAIRESFIDKRDPHKITYPLDVVIIIILLAKLVGCNTAEDISRFFKIKNLQLQLIIPGMPDVEHGLSPSTINTVISMITYEEINRFFVEYFSSVKIALDDLITYNNDKYKSNREGTKDTIAFDGQEIRASFKRGVQSRRAKGANVVTIYNCTQRTPLNFINAKMKNNEVDSFLALAVNTDIRGSVVMSDALNTASSVTDLICKRGADYLMPIKASRGNKELLIHVEAIFNRERKHSIKSSCTNKDHGRLEVSEFEILEASKYLDSRIKNTHKHVNTIVKYTKTVEKIVAGESVKKTSQTRYYISSLIFDEITTMNQIKASICDYWFIEQAHNLYDSMVFNQDRLQACNENTLSVHAGINKICHNILGFIRQKLSERPGQSTPMPYALVQKTIASWPIFTIFEYIANYYATKLDD